MKENYTYKNLEETSNTPQLRFPEFTGEWKEKKLGDFFELRNGYAFKSDSYLENGKYIIITIANVQSGKLDLSKFNTLSVIPDNLADYQKLKEGDILVSMTGNVGRVCMVDKPNCLLNQRVGLLEQKNRNIDKKYIYHLINSSQFEDAMIKSAQGAAQANISKENIEHFAILLPPTLAEQQKIAECLSSLDDMIRAEGQKTEALREYKRGLMQQLFPANGSTTPQLRFPGFTGEWKEKKLGEVCNSFKTGKLDANAMVEGGKYRFYTCSKDYSFIDTYAFDGDCILIAGNGAHLGYVHHYRGKFNAYQRTYVLADFSCNSNYIEYCIKHFLPNRITMEKKEGNMPYIVLSTLTEMHISLPPTLAEQQKIADCLSSLDDMISAQAQKTETLREYKRGLMQQLFPQPSK